MASLTITSLYAGILALIYIVLSVRIIQLRWRHRVGIGTNKVEELQRAVRAHGNFIEYVPLMLLMFALIEFNGVGSTWVYALGGVLTVARIAHALGLSSSAGVSLPRTIGVAGTFGVLLLQAGILIGIFVGQA
ncbi:hypothetical protein DFP83_10749 [Idiomarina fontislapidosi]|uniref:Glutathione S-transferase n=1 Tax=Idiomarina fontislapidosi TaxID=263723 RepID=A0A432XWZ5_9GAMM|nr:MAPEG family protein [Idiomarina fontislapidosi]PYE32040.1 hypothetical protein DFP83_10749 [Idiomarina fontislapidosi]RUO53246.1 glutathione S-transferase [Idiomarina fontislapidosi]